MVSRVSFREHPRIHAFKEILDAINTSGGHIFACLVVGFCGVFLGAYLTWLAWPDTQLVAAFAAITGAMTGFFQTAAYAMQGHGKANGEPPPGIHSSTSSTLDSTNAAGVRTVVQDKSTAHEIPPKVS